MRNYFTVKKKKKKSLTRFLRHYILYRLKTNGRTPSISCFSCCAYKIPFRLPWTSSFITKSPVVLCSAQLFLLPSPPLACTHTAHVVEKMEKHTENMTLLARFLSLFCRFRHWWPSHIPRFLDYARRHSTHDYPSCPPVPPESRQSTPLPTVPEPSRFTVLESGTECSRKSNKLDFGGLIISVRKLPKIQFNLCVFNSCCVILLLHNRQILYLILNYIIVS